MFLYNTSYWLFMAPAFSVDAGGPVVCQFNLSQMEPYPRQAG